MPSLVGTTIARNYVKAVETSKMGTRELAFFQVDMNTDVATGYTDSDSLYAKAVKGIQTVVETYAVGVPNGEWFTVVAAADTATFDSGESNGDGNRNSKIEAAINEATGESCRVFNGKLEGDAITNDC
jgi:hypothetical protein